MMFYEKKQALKKVDVIFGNIIRIRSGPNYAFIAYSTKYEKIKIKEFLEHSDNLYKKFLSFYKKFDKYFGYTNLGIVNCVGGVEVKICDYKKDVTYLGEVYKRASKETSEKLLLLHGNIKVFLVCKYAIDSSLNLKDVVMNFEKMKTEVLEYNKKIDDLVAKIDGIDGENDSKAACLLAEAVRHGARLSGAIEIFLQFCEQESKNIQDGKHER